MSKLHVTARLKIKDGRLGDFKTLAAQCMEIVKAKDTGTRHPRRSWTRSDPW
jgi:hypothetical protein